ncbi:MAG TPA: methylated-DNA--[protein]-cysteine S-methyltransferase [Armatimonadota bacterium]|nr:methylated-DNA--[protein]-cysteine S-methyltransferase [Armatimonadota bacterium]
MTYYTLIESPIGPLLLTSDGALLTGLYMAPHPHGPDWTRADDAAPLPEARRQLAAYFDGSSTTFDLPLAFNGTPFQKRVWEELARIPYGVTLSYAELARRVGNSNACRAVGAANGRNPISIIVPCHRVIGSGGKLVGYGGGLTRKEVLLALEARVLAESARGASPADVGAPRDGG